MDVNNLRKTSLPPLPNKKPTPLKKIVDNRATFWVSLVLVGPFALPLLWRDPRYPSFLKFIITLGVLALTYYLSYGLYKQVEDAMKMVKQLQDSGL